MGKGLTETLRGKKNNPMLAAITTAHMLFLNKGQTKGNMN